MEATKEDIKETELEEDFKFLIETLRVAEANPDKSINKAVGALVVKDGKVVGKGIRRTYVLQKNPYKDITFHAEHDALTQAGKDAREGTLYTTLEPCTKRSKGSGWNAPEPCCKIISESGIKKVVIGSFDEDFGQGGAKYLMERGIKVLRVKGIDEKKFEDLTNNPKISNEDAKKLQEEVYRNLKTKSNSS